MFTGWTAEFLRKSKTDGTKEEKKSTWNPRQRDAPSGARRSSRRLNPSSGLRKQAWGVAPTEALVTAEEEEKPADTGGRARRAPVRPVDQDEPQKLTLLSLEKNTCQHQKMKQNSRVRTNSRGHRLNTAVDVKEGEDVRYNWRGNQAVHILKVESKWGPTCKMINQGWSSQMRGRVWRKLLIEKPSWAQLKTLRLTVSLLLEKWWLRKTLAGKYIKDANIKYAIITVHVRARAYD